MEDEILYAARYTENSGSRPLAHLVKEGDKAATAQMAREMAEKLVAALGGRAVEVVLVPVPGRTGRATVTKDLAMEIGRLTGAKVADVLTGADRESLYDIKKQGGVVEPEILKLQIAAGVAPEDFQSEVYLVDNVIATGTTFEAAKRVIPGAKLLVHSIAVDHRKYYTLPEEAVQNFEGGLVANEAEEMGTDGGWSDYQLQGIKAHSYRLVEVPVAEILGADPDLAAYVKAGQLRRFDGEANLDFAPIISDTGEVLDGYNRILQHVQNGAEKIYVYRAVEDSREKIKGGIMENNKEQGMRKTYPNGELIPDVITKGVLGLEDYNAMIENQDAKLGKMRGMTFPSDIEEAEKNLATLKMKREQIFGQELAKEKIPTDDVTIKNEYLLNHFKDNPGQTERVTEQMAKATQGLKEATDLAPGEKKKIASELNSEAGADVIRYWADKPRDLIFAGICMTKGGDPYLHEMYTRPDNRPAVDEEFTVHNKHLMEKVEGLPDLERKYKAAQESLSKEVFYSTITFSDKKKIVAALNSEAGAQLIARHSEQAEVVVYAGLCMAEGGAAALDKYPIPDAVKIQSVAAGKVSARNKDKAADMGI